MIHAWGGIISAVDKFTVMQTKLVVVVVVVVVVVF